MRTLLTISAISLAIAACGGGGGAASSNSSGTDASNPNTDTGFVRITSKFLAQRCALSAQSSDPTWWRCLEGGYFEGFTDTNRKIPCTLTISKGRFIYSSQTISGATIDFNEAIASNNIAYSEYFHGFSPAQGAHRFVGQIFEGKDGRGWIVRIETTHDRIPGFYDPSDNNIQFGYSGGSEPFGFCYIPSLTIGK